jgi:hypothetical protein
VRARAPAGSRRPGTRRRFRRDCYGEQPSPSPLRVRRTRLSRAESAAALGPQVRARQLRLRRFRRHDSTHAFCGGDGPGHRVPRCQRKTRAPITGRAGPCVGALAIAGPRRGDSPVGRKAGSQPIQAFLFFFYIFLSPILFLLNF